MDFTPKIQKCISSLKKFESAETSQTLLDKPASIWLSVGLQNLPSNLKSTVKPHRIPITNSIRKNDTVCVIIKDQAPQKEVIKAIENIEKVYSFSKLKQFSTHEAKRAFCNGYDFFLADERILPMLPQKLGKTFFKKKKQPVPIELSTNKETMEKRIFESIHQSTYLFMNFGSCWTVKVGNVGMSEAELVQNTNDALKGIVELIPKKWKNVQNINLKTNSSIALPVFDFIDEDAAEKQAVAEVTETPVESAKEEEPKAKKVKKEVKSKKEEKIVANDSKEVPSKSKIEEKSKTEKPKKKRTTEEVETKQTKKSKVEKPKTAEKKTEKPKRKTASMKA